MTPAIHPSMLMWAGIAALVAWRLFSRVRRLVGRQKLKQRRAMFTVIFFPLLLAMLLVFSLPHPERLAGLLGGVLMGAALGWYGLRLTKFESTADGLFYTPNAHIGIALSVLFIGRVIYRLAHGVLVVNASDAPRGLSPDFASSPLTLVIFGTLAAYYVCYAIGLIRWQRRLENEPARTDTTAPSDT